jgi:NAD(P)-dependent dehydrogenase (short-subunit alcohol dehydrogenase family)
MFSEKLLAGRRILVTGGGTGLGKAMATRFLELGAEIHICGRRKSVCDETATELMDLHGGRVTSHGVDIRNAQAVDEMVDLIFKDAPLTDLVNNAAGNFLAFSETVTPNGFDAVVKTVLHGTVHCTLAFGRQLMERKAPGAVVSIVTTYAWTGTAYALPSACAKAGVLAMTRSLAVEWGHAGIRLNAIAPGPIPTEGAFSRLMPTPETQRAALARIPLGRFGETREIANLAAFLLSDLCPYQTGDCVTMDGGEWLAGAGEFSDYRRVPREKLKAGFDALKPKKG